MEYPYEMATVALSVTRVSQHAPQCNQ